MPWLMSEILVLSWWDCRCCAGDNRRVYDIYYDFNWTSTIWRIKYIKSSILVQIYVCIYHIFLLMYYFILMVDGHMEFWHPKLLFICWDVWKNALSCSYQIWSWYLLIGFHLLNEKWKYPRPISFVVQGLERTWISIFFLCLLSGNCRCCTGYNTSEFHAWGAIDIEF